MADNEPVTSPDQHKPGPKRAARFGAVVVIFGLLAMICANNNTKTGMVFLIVTAGILAAILIGDWLLRKNGLRS